MPYPFVGAVRMTRPGHHHDGGDDVGNRCHEAALDDAQMGTVLLLESGDDRREKEPDRVQAVGDSEVDERQ